MTMGKKLYFIVCGVIVSGILAACSGEMNTGSDETLNPSMSYENIDNEETSNLISGSESESGSEQELVLNSEILEKYLNDYRENAEVHSIDRDYICFDGYCYSGQIFETSAGNRELLGEQILKASNQDDITQYFSEKNMTFHVIALQKVVPVLPCKDYEATFGTDGTNMYVYMNKSEAEQILCEYTDESGKRKVFCGRAMKAELSTLQILNEFYADWNDCQLEWNPEHHSAQMAGYYEDKNEAEVMEFLFRHRFEETIDEGADEHYDRFALLKMDDEHYLEFFDAADPGYENILHVIVHVVYDGQDFFVAGYENVF